VWDSYNVEFVQRCSGATFPRSLLVASVGILLAAFLIDALATAGGSGPLSGPGEDDSEPAPTPDPAPEVDWEFRATQGESVWTLTN